MTKGTPQQRLVEGPEWGHPLGHLSGLTSSEPWSREAEGTALSTDRGWRKAHTCLRRPQGLGQGVRWLGEAGADGEQIPPRASQDGSPLPPSSSPRHSLKSLTSTPDPLSSRTSFLICLRQGLLFVLQNSMGFEKYIMPFICQYLSNTVRNFIILKIPFHLPCPPPQPQPRSNH